MPCAHAAHIARAKPEKAPPPWVAPSRAARSGTPEPRSAVLKTGFSWNRLLVAAAARRHGHGAARSFGAPSPGCAAAMSNALVARSWRRRSHGGRRLVGSLAGGAPSRLLRRHRAQQRTLDSRALGVAYADERGGRAERRGDALGERAAEERR